MSKKGAKKTTGNASFHVGSPGLPSKPSAPPRETEAFQPQMRERLLRSLARFPFESGGVLGISNTFTRSHFREAEDLRYGKPHTRSLVERQYKRLDGTSAGYSRQYVPVQNRMRGLQEALRLQFQQPRQTLVCVRRQARRRVLFALQALPRKRGKGAGRKARWSASSYIQCRGVK